MSDTDPRSRRVVVPGVRWLRFPRRLETEYRDYQCREAVEGFRVNAFYILLLYVLLITGIYALAPEAVRGRWLATYTWVGVIVLVAGGLAQVSALNRYFPGMRGWAVFLPWRCPWPFPALSTAPLPFSLPMCR